MSLAQSLITYLEEKCIPSSRPVLVEIQKNRSTTTITYGELWGKVDRLASALTKLGLQPGERVALVLPNSITWVVSFLAVLKAGGIAVPLRSSATPVELKRLITNVKPSLFLGDGSLINRSLPFDLLEGGEQVIICSKQFMIRSAIKKRIHRLHTLLRQKYRGQKSLVTINESQVAAINSTYRGYGYPLYANLTHGNMINGIKAYVQTAGLHERQRFLVALPFSHVYPLIGCLLAPITTGSTAIIVTASSAKSIWEVISRYQPIVLTGVPTLYTSLLHSSNLFTKQDLKIEEAICGGSLMSLSLYEQARNRLGISLRQGYGLTECLPVTCNPISPDNRPETLGKVVIGADGVDVRIFGENGEEKSTGEIGEIVVTGPTVMSGYYSMPRETAAAVRDGWFYAGDYGWFDAEGYLYFSGVKKRIAKVAGNMVDLTEVEREILTCPDVSYAKVYTTPDTRLGEIVNADITCCDSAELDAKSIRRYLKNRLASYKIPLIMHVGVR